MQQFCRRRQYIFDDALETVDSVLMEKVSVWSVKLFVDVGIGVRVGDGVDENVSDGRSVSESVDVS